MECLYTLAAGRYKVFILLFTMLVFPVSAFAASFDCEKAQAVVEKIICGSQELSALDRQLDSLYLAVTEQHQREKERIKNDQLRWLEQRNFCEYRFDCIKSAYQARLSSLNKQLTGEPREGVSWGGKIRQQASLSSPQVGSTKNGQALSVLRVTNETFNSYAWFEIEADGVTGFQWGGILCVPSVPTLSYCE